MSHNGSVIDQALGGLCGTDRTRGQVRWRALRLPTGFPAHIRFAERSRSSARSSLSADKSSAPAIDTPILEAKIPHRDNGEQPKGLNIGIASILNRSPENRVLLSRGWFPV
jgi:hypothetical protein